MMMSRIHPHELSSMILPIAISSGTTSIPVIDFRVADAILRCESTNICSIREGVLIPRPNPKVSARVIQSFSIQLFPSEEGYIAASDLCNITELEKTKGEAVLSYLHSLVDELIWLQKHVEHLSKPLREELNRVRAHIQIVS
jgi:hypothetical protein